MTTSSKDGLRITLKILAAMFVAAQFVRPDIDNPPVQAELSTPNEIKRILRRACYDCHSNETDIPWFDQIVPAYWLVARDVREGREHLNFSELGREPAARQKAVLFESVNHVLLGAMPPRAYLAVHRGARVTAEEREALTGYLRTLTESPTPPAASAPHPVRTPENIQPAPNGIEFPRDYARWRPISGTDRWDNGSLRAVLGNERALRAIAEADVDPWPDGAALAKIAWTGRRDTAGGTETGDFHQVEFMFKDRARFAKTEGWGFARWRGRDLVPYGKDADFAEECLGCHAPMRGNDFVFTTPIQRGPRASQRLNSTAAIGALGTLAPLDGSVLALTVDPRGSNFSMLLGNQEASEGEARVYAPDSLLALVTWSSVDDERWFGARVPSQVERVDLLKLTPGPDGEASWSHERYARRTARPEPPASSLVRVPVDDREANATRLEMLSLSVAAMPGSSRRGLDH